MLSRDAVRLSNRSAVRASWWGLGLGLSVCGLLVASPFWAVGADPVVAGAPAGSTFYSTAAPPADFAGPTPSELDVSVVDPLSELEKHEPAATDPLDNPPTRLANVSNSSVVAPIQPVAPAHPAPAPSIAAPVHKAPADPITQAKAIIAESRARYQQIHDYTCTFFKRERVDGRMTPQFVMSMKFRAKPHSVYFKFVKPSAGREAIYIAGRNGGKALVHDVGIGKLLAGTLALDPRSRRAMEDNRHPITDAGLGHMIEELYSRWETEMKHGETLVAIREVQVGARPCTMVESTHPVKGPNYLFHKVKVYIDHEHGMPIRFEAYDWPRRAGAQPELVEEYIYANLRLNPGLRESEFDPSNAQYSFGRF
jgi:hypothetical protein